METRKIIFWIIGAVLVFGAICFIFMLCHDFFKSALLLLLLCCLIAGTRLLIGPGRADRAVGVFVIGLLIVGFCGIMAVFSGRGWYVDIALVWTVQNFIAGLTLAKFLEGKRFDD